MPRLPGRHDQPVTPLQMSVTDAVVFAQQIASGFGGQAPWRRVCACHHRRPHHRPGGGACRHCPCRQYAEAEHEEMVIDLHPDSINYLPEDVYVILVGNRPRLIGPDGRGGAIMGYQYVLGRDLGIPGPKAVHSGVRKETHVFTDEPEDWHDRQHEGAADERLDRPKEDE